MNEALKFEEFTAAGDWMADTLAETDWRLALPAAVVEELDAALEDGAPAREADTARFEATRGFLAAVRARLLVGPGVVVAGRLPVADWGPRRSFDAVALLARLMGPPMAQTLGATTLYAVRDTGARPAPGVRRSLTNVHQPFHTDGPWLRRPADIVGLYCLESASNGGESLCLGLGRLCRDMASRDRALFQRLRGDFLWHRQAEHADHESPVSRLPVVWEAGGACGVRLYTDYVRSGHRAAGDALDSAGGRALQMFEEMADQPRRWLRFHLRPGEVEWVNNHACAHARTAFESLDEAVRHRLLVRVWHRLDGSTGLED